ncbi:MupG family TIM beta-alpha barrel fold protein [Xylocopilactobacillus apis]|uniref:PTS-associated protein n=1 Tax=Xylocopilactobacillus apis TaxID=2932183 RepID=A0AAU9D6V4_9LACO|nr:MupG family TIM beta-alpha barrel fold protein [Xylocopilactobacillus apis]BDR57145.1 PTS-associated protein [Xylocopilactobacillus apis]
MLGFSIYLHQEIDTEVKTRIKEMTDAGFKGVFSSLNLPEDDPQYLLKRLFTLGNICQENDLLLTVDISQSALKRLEFNIDDLSNLLDYGISQLRLDDGFSMEEVAELSKNIKIALNASTISENDFEILRKNDADFNNIEAWHNFYPRKNTGLDQKWFIDRNRWLIQHDLQVMAFVPGDGKLRGPVFSTLPTLESDRYQRPLAPAIKMLNQGISKVYIGDESLSDASLKQFEAYTKHDTILLNVKCCDVVPTYFGQVLHQRPDLARDAIRIIEGRNLKEGTVTPDAMPQNRSRGSITIDNIDAKRYEGELQFIKNDLPADKTVNVVGQVVKEDLNLLDVFKPNQAVKLVEN